MAGGDSRMISCKIRASGLDRIGRRNANMNIAARDVDGLAREFKDHIWDRIGKMKSRPGGSVRGRYSGGFGKWTDNAASTIAKKGFNRPLYSTPNGSKLLRLESFIWGYGRKQTARNSVAGQFTLDNEKDYAIYNHEGTDHIPARPFLGFFQGDMKWLLERGQKKGLAIR